MLSQAVKPIVGRLKRDLRWRFAPCRTARSDCGNSLCAVGHRRSNSARSELEVQTLTLLLLAFELCQPLFGLSLSLFEHDLPAWRDVERGSEEVTAAVRRDGRTGHVRALEDDARDLLGGHAWCRRCHHHPHLAETSTLQRKRRWTADRPLMWHRTSRWQSLAERTTSSCNDTA